MRTPAFIITAIVCACFLIGELFILNYGSSHAFSNLKYVNRYMFIACVVGGLIGGIAIYMLKWPLLEFLFQRGYIERSTALSLAIDAIVLSIVYFFVRPMTKEIYTEIMFVSAMIFIFGRNITIDR